MKRCVVGIRRPGDTRSPSGDDAPTVWFPLMATVPSEDKQAKFPAALAEITREQAPKLSRSARTMESHGLVALEKNSREIEPIAPATSFKTLIDERASR